MLSEEEYSLLKGLRAHDEDAWRTLFRKHYGVLCVIAAGYVGDDFTAETVVGDVLYDLFRKVDAVTVNVSLRAYLVQSVRNRCLDMLKKKGAVPAAPEELSRLAEQMASGEHPLGQLMEKELESSVTKAIDALPSRSREVFKMSRFDGLEYGEIAQKLGISVNTVKYHMKKALALLRTSLGEYFPLALLILLLHSS